MWTYIQTPFPNELYHHGVKGMKWGKRKKYYNSDGSLNKLGKARQDYKSAKKKANEAERIRARKRWNPTYGWGIKGIKTAQGYDKRVNDTAVKAMNAKVNYKTAKAKDNKKAAKAEFKVYRSAMQKTGLHGSHADTQNAGKSTRIYNEIKARKGSKYADRVEKSVRNRAVATIATSAVVTIGSAVVSAYLQDS